jgi:hypothetical protein
MTQGDQTGPTKMKHPRIALLAFAAILGLSTLAGSAPASATDWSFLSNKPYMDCLKLFYTGDFLIPANATPAQRAEKHEQGRRYCNRQYYGHD